ncbi:hypothetical protein PG993_000257 [Apiospora rasikravindrae]|uniref:Uncharacterized protein n=1 Tax=Apiospora rasikravindrae TaxID=990691 RepID=A0ABR1U834_9PEZI
MPRSSTSTASPDRRSLPFSIAISAPGNNQAQKSIDPCRKSQGPSPPSQKEKGPSMNLLNLRPFPTLAEALLEAVLEGPHPACIATLTAAWRVKESSRRPFILAPTPKSERRLRCAAAGGRDRRCATLGDPGKTGTPQILRKL